MGYFDKTGPLRNFQQFLAGGSFVNWLRLLRENGLPDLRYLVRGLYITATSLLSTPFRLYENLRYGPAIRRTELTAAPIFIIGHWRSGTTHVMRVLGRNPDLAVVTFVHTMIPELFLGSRLFRYILSNSLPPVRPMDNVTIAPDEAEEEEYAMGNLGPWSFYHALAFPRRMRAIFDRCVLFEGLDEPTIEGWKAVYLRFLKKVALATGNRRLLLKNPANTARIRVLLQMFPDARFIHVYRNPYVVYESTIHWLDKEMEDAALQDVDAATIREHAMTNYARLMRRYLEDRHLIPADHLVEVRFEDFERDPWAQIERIHECLGIDLTPPARARIEGYLGSLKDYRKNAYRMDARQREEVAERWGFAIREWDYAPPPDD